MKAFFFTSLFSIPSSIFLAFFIFLLRPLCPKFSRGISCVLHDYSDSRMRGGREGSRFVIANLPLSKALPVPVFAVKPDLTGMKGMKGIKPEIRPIT